MVHIKIIKTFMGEKKYAVVDEFNHTTQDINENEITRKSILVVDYKSGNTNYPAIFPYTEEGLEKAKEVQKILKNNNKNS